MWRWRVLAAPSGADERTKAGDDFAARVYVVFRLSQREENALGVFDRMRRRLGEGLYGQEMPGSSLNYVWARTARAGSHWPNPYDAANRMIALRSGAAGGTGWHEESVDLLADHRTHFPEAGPGPPEAMAIAIMSDSDGTCSRAAAEIGGLELLAPGPRPAKAVGREPGT